MSLTAVEESLIMAAYFRGGSQTDRRWISNTDQILTLSLFYTGDISYSDCADRFAVRKSISKLYDKERSEENSWGTLTGEIDTRYKILINLLKRHPKLIEGGGDLETPAHPTFTACRLTDAGLKLATELIDLFPTKPDFPNWPDRRTPPDSRLA